MSSAALIPNSLVLIEEAADEIARLDSVCLNRPAGVGLALRFILIADLHDRTPETFRTLAASHADPYHEPSVQPAARQWLALLSTEERRVRGGALLSVARFADAAPDLATYPDRSRLEAIWHEERGSRPLLMRALDSAAWSSSTAVGELSATLLLCAGGRTDRARFLPFTSVSAAVRAECTNAWRTGDTEPWARAALAAAAQRARRLRESVQAIAAPGERDEALLDPIGRAAITARRALAQLRVSLAVTMPSLAEDLSLSRPAAADALERLVDLGLAREVTGRARDRVYAWAAACAVADAALAS